MLRSKVWVVGSLFAVGLCQPVVAAELLVWGSQGSQASIVSFLESSGHTVTNLGNVAPTTAELANIDVAIDLRAEGNSDVAAWVSGGGCLITEWSGAAWALDTANLLEADVSSAGFIETNTPVTITAAGIAAGLDSGVANPYVASQASEFFHTFSNIGPNVQIMATRPTDVPAILGGTSGAGLVLANGIDWGDGFDSTSADNKQLLLNSVEQFCSGARAPATPVPSMSSTGLALLAGALLIFGLMGFKMRRKS